MTSPPRKKTDPTTNFKGNLWWYSIKNNDLSTLLDKCNKGTAYFQFRLKSSGFRIGWRKPSIEHFTQVKAAWAVRPWKVRRFKEI